MKTSLLCGVLFTGVLLATGCAEGRLYPVQGPYAALSPVPVFTAKASGAFKSGSISVVLKDGEKGSGRWIAAEAGPASVMNTSAGGSTENMASIWDFIYGQGFYVSRVLGSKLFARAEVHGDKGTVLQMQMYRSPGDDDAPINIRGIAKDNHGNIYKVVF